MAGKEANGLKVGEIIKSKFYFFRFPVGLGLSYYIWVSKFAKRSTGIQASSESPIHTKNLDLVQVKNDRFPEQPECDLDMTQI